MKRQNFGMNAAVDVLCSAVCTFTFGLVLTSCGIVGPSRERAIKTAIEQAKETMDVAAPDLPHPEPYKYQDTGDCAWVPELPSSKETLRYQAEIPLPPGDDGLDRQARAVKYWVDKGAKIRELPYRHDPPGEVNYGGGSILMFAMPTRGRAAAGGSTFYISVTTPCVSKES